MTAPTSFPRLAWLLVLVVALGFTGWNAATRAQRVRAVTQSVPTEAVATPQSITGYAGGTRTLVIPASNVDASQWVLQVQQLLAQHAWRLRTIEYENAPFGRRVLTPSPYRWWLLSVAAAHRTLTGSSAGASIEFATLYADPICHALLLLSGTLVVAWRLGRLAAAGVAAGFTFLFPLAGIFLPGVPDELGLALAFAWWSVLPLLIAFHRGGRGGPPAQRSRWMAIGGLAGGVALWISPAQEVPVLAGIALGALLATRLKGAKGDRAPGSWLVWAGMGAVTSSIGYLVEAFPDRLGEWELREVHPLYSLAWLGLGILLHLQSTVSATASPARRPGRILAGAFALAAVVALPVGMRLVHSTGFLAADLASFRLSRLDGGAEYSSLFGWLGQDGITPIALATLLPTGLLVPAIWMLASQSRPDSPGRCTLALALGPALVVLLFAAWRLNAFSAFDVLLVALLAAALNQLDEERVRPPLRWMAFSLLAALLIPGAVRLLPPRGNLVLTNAEFLGLIERDLAHWLAKRAGPDAKPVVLAPPNETSALSYYGGLPGLATLSPDNRDGLAAAVRILSATSPQEAQALVERRGVTHIILPSWDAYLTQYVRAGTAQADNSFLGNLRDWTPPAWLRPVPYTVPQVPGFENQTIAVFEVVEEQSDAVALSRLAIYFVETGRLDYAAAIEKTLQRYPADLGAVAARAELLVATNDQAALADVLRTITPKLNAGADRTLPWERRAGLAVVLARVRQNDLARAQVERCFRDATEPRLRSLSTTALYRLLVVAKRYGLALPYPRLAALARDLIPADSRPEI